MPPADRIGRAIGNVRTAVGVGLRPVVDWVGGRRSIVGLGLCFLALAVWQTVVLLQAGLPSDVVALLFVLVAAPALGLLYGGSRLPRSDVHPDFYPTVAGWSLAGVAAMSVGLAVYELPPDGGITNPVQSVPVLLVLAAFAGFSAGVHDARARTRERELKHRNRQLERTRQELESTVRRLRTSNERLEAFAYAASHDLQEPLRMVSSYLQLIESRHGDDLDDDAEEYLEYACDGADRMRAMIEGLLAYSRVETQAAPLEPVDLEAVVDDVREDLQLQIEESSAEISVGSLPTVQGDASQLRQVFQNLLDNAIEYSGDDPPTVEIGAKRRGDTVEVAVEDDGIGIEAEYTDRVFEVFQRLHSREDHPGTGIGLALVERIVDRHDGDIWVDSEPGDGSTFYVSLPAASDDEADVAGNTDARPERAQASDSDIADSDDVTETDAEPPLVER